MRQFNRFQTALLCSVGAMVAAFAPLTLAALEVPFSVVGTPSAQPVAPGHLVTLPAGSEDLLFSGETARNTMLFVAEASQLAGVTDLYLTVQSAISVAPEWSQLSVAINDQVIGSTPLKSGEPYPVKLSVPPGLLQPGYNAVTFTVDQAHRVDCSVDATYELWTRIDPLQSGFAFEARQAGIADYGSILATVRSAGGGTQLNGLVDGGADTTADALVALFQTIAIGAAIDRPEVNLSSTAGTGPGLDVVTGGQPDVTRRLAASGMDMPVGPGITIGRRADGRIVLAVVADTDADFKAALASVADGLRQASTGAPAGLAALDRLKGVPVAQNGVLSFAQLGIDGRDFGGRSFHQKATFRLPTDFYPADYAQAEINLDALYSSGLSRGAALQFKLNDRIVSTLNLTGSRNGEARGRSLPIQLSAFRPGLNELEIEATLPARMDAECTPGTTANNGRRLQLAGSSTLELPTLARIGRFPDLGAIETSIVGRDPSASLTVVTSGTGSADARAAAAFLTRLAYASGRAIPVSFASAMDLDDKRPTLVVAASGQLPAEIRQALPVDLAANPVAPAYEFAVALKAPTELPDQPAGSDTTMLPNVDILTADARAVLDDLRSSLYGLGMSVGLPVEPLRRAQIAGEAPAIGTDLLVAQMLNPQGTAPVTVLTAQSEAQITQALPNLLARSWGRLDGAAAAFASTGEKLQQVKAQDVQYYPGTDASLGNLRLVAAGWLSNTPTIYVVLVFVAALLLGLLTNRLLVRTRRKT